MTAPQARGIHDRIGIVNHLAAATGPVTAAVRGYVELPYTPTTCMQGTHFLTDPCTGWAALLDDYQAIDLEPYLCRHVVVDGPDVGIECPVIASDSIVPVQPTCPIGFSILEITTDPTPFIVWSHVTCAASYDLIRGDVAALRTGASQVDLGPVACIANDIAQPLHHWQVRVSGDSLVPPLGAAFFYLARANGVPFGDMTYGRSTDGRERVPAEGDCVP